MDISVLEKCPLFKGIPSYSITPMMGCLRAHEKYYGKNEFIYRSGDKISEISIVLSGNVQVIKEDMWGNTTILANLKEGMLFGEAFVLGGVDKIPLSVLSSEKSRVLFLDKKRTVTPCAPVRTVLFGIDFASKVVCQRALLSPVGSVKRFKMQRILRLPLATRAPLDSPFTLSYGRCDFIVVAIRFIPVSSRFAECPCNPKGAVL